MSNLILPEAYTPSTLVSPSGSPLFKRPEDLVKPGAVLLKPAPAKLFNVPGFIDKEENNIANDVFVRKLLQFAEEEAEKNAHLRRHNPRTYPPIAGGAAGAWTLTNELRVILQGASGAIVPATDTVKIALLLSTSNIGATSTTYAAVTNEVATANGYTQAGVATTLTVSTVSTSNGQLAFTQAQWTASGGSITARFGLMYKVAGHIYGYFLCDSTPADVTATNGNTFTISAGNIWTLS